MTLLRNFEPLRTQVEGWRERVLLRQLSRGTCRNDTKRQAPSGVDASRRGMSLILVHRAVVLKGRSIRSSRVGVREGQLTR
jgi:hypothetical protein